MKTTTRTPRNGSALRATKQASTQPASSPAEFKVVRLRECPTAGAKILEPAAVEKFWREHVVSAPWFKADKECMVVFLLDARRQLMGFEMLSQGTKDIVLVNVPEVFRMAVMRSAAAIIVTHNHPSGDPLPSEADIKITRDLIRAGELIKIDVDDSVIIGAQREGAKGYSSLRELGYYWEKHPIPAATPATGESAGAVKAAPVEATVQKAEPIKRESTIRNEEPDMEEAVQRTLGLVDLLGRMDSVTTRDDGHHSYTGIGYQVLCDDCRKALHDDWNAAHDAKANRGGDKIATSRKLGATVGKARVLLLMLAHDLSGGGYFDDYELSRDNLDRDFPDTELSPYLSLAADCTEYLEASYYADFGRDVPWRRFQKEHFEELLQKFPKAAEERRAA